jgi:HD-GYP domain-containing protein (c-di-GMP phosphodiesterase class II)
MAAAVYDPLSEELLAAARERKGARLSRAEQTTYLSATVGFAAVALLFILLGETAGGPVNPWTVAVLVGSYALAARLEFEVGSTLAIATELVLVSMLFLLPPEQLPVWVVAGSLLSQLPDYLRGGTPPQRMLVIVGSSWYAFGPAIVFVLFQPEPAMDARTLLVLAGALAAQFAVDFVSAAAREWAALRTPPRQVAAQLPFVFAIDLALAPLGLLTAIAAQHDPRVLVLPLPLLFLGSLSRRERRRRLDQALELSSAYRGTAFLLGDVVEADDSYTGAHSRDVLELVLAVCDELGVDPATRMNAEFAAILHDVGKINIPPEIINKPGPLSPDERAIVERHTVDGERMLQRVGGRLAQVGEIVRACHERWDGGGYPDRLAGEQIPPVARIVCCCDALSAMTTDRSYRRALPLADALAELDACAGSQFDPQVVAALTGLIRSGRLRRAPQLTLLAAVG